MNQHNQLIQYPTHFLNLNSLCTCKSVRNSSLDCIKPDVVRHTLPVACNAIWHKGGTSDKPITDASL